jgi:hypothetical protein
MCHMRLSPGNGVLFASRVPQVHPDPSLRTRRKVELGLPRCPPHGIRIWDFVQIWSPCEGGPQICTVSNPDTWTRPSRVTCVQRRARPSFLSKIFQRGQDRNEYRVPRSQGDTESTVRIRVRHLRGHLWSDWSQTLSFGQCPLR